MKETGSSAGRSRVWRTSGAVNGEWECGQERGEHARKDREGERSGG